MQPDKIVPTTITRVMLKSMERTHVRRRISVYAGPPGIGKTTAITAFAAERPGEIVIVEPFTRRTNERLIYQAMLLALRRVSHSHYTGVERDGRMIRNQLAQEIMVWARKKPNDTFAEGDVAEHLTFVFDEAQNIPSIALDALRHMNDWTPYRDQLKVGLIFVGNHEFTLEVDTRGRVAMLDAFKDRLLDQKSFRYSDLSNDDLTRFIASRGIDDAEAQSLIVRAFKDVRTTRSLRRISDKLDDILEEASGAAVTASIVLSVLNPA